MGSLKLKNGLRGYYRDAEEWLKETKLDRKKHLRTIGSRKKVKLKEPEGLEKPVHWRLRFPSGQPLRSRQGLVTIVPGGHICRTSDILTKDNKLIWSLSKDKGDTPEEHAIFHLKKLPPLQKVSGNVAVLSHRTGSAYYHWMLDLLPRLELIRRCRIPVDKYIINGKKLSSFHYETLEMLGIPKKNIIESNNKLYLQAKRLIVPTFTSGVRPKWILEFLRKKLQQSDVKRSKEYERVYISRKNASKRKLLNEAEVVKRLEKYGFRSVILEKLPLREQLRIFASAKIIAGPHGSGLTNVIFSKPGIKVIEFFSPRFVDRCYPILSSLLGHEHYYLIGKGKRPPEFARYPDRRPDLTIDMKDLDRLLKLAGIAK